ncbi:MAG TPA: cupin domain-containing protein [Candidatus Marinimicrobia bacterium]|jgi:quercetin dioxygenase-like cupin family protein|nr:cupin domain-containing protein [Candidatus Neomarinimicrobiota bacterium]HPY00802.1 cupin domain-containing protein [Candidatus Neomarinimicrobiota bacterium]
MIIRKVKEVPAEPVAEPGAENVRRQVLLSPSEGAPHFTLRRFEIAPGGQTMYHHHNYEHEIYVLAGVGKARGRNSEVKINQDDAILVLPNEEHQIVNTGITPLIFLCLIPNQ